MSLLLAVLLQGLSIARELKAAILVGVSVGPGWALVARGLIGAVALGGRLHSVSGATGLSFVVGTQTVKSVSGTNGAAVGFRALVVSPAYGTPQSYSASGFPPGVSMSSLGVVTGVPTSSGVFLVSLTGWQNRPPGNSADLADGHFFATSFSFPVVDVAPTILIQPTNQTAQVGGAVTFSVQAKGGDLVYQWIQDGVELGGATNNTLRISPVTADSAGGYQVRVSNSGGVALSSNAVLSVGPALAATILPSTGGVIDLHAGETLTLSAAVTGGAPLAYHWTHNGQPIPSAGAATLQVGPAGPADVGWYGLSISTSAGTVLAAPVQLGVGPPLGLELTGRPLGLLGVVATTLPGRVYRLSSTPMVTNLAWTLVQEWTATNTPTTLQTPFAGGAGFFRVEALDPH